MIKDAFIRISLSRCDEVPSLRPDSKEVGSDFLRADKRATRNLSEVRTSGSNPRREMRSMPIRER